MGNVTRRARARTDLIEIWCYVADDDVFAADRMLDRFEQALSMLSANPRAGRERPELGSGLRSFPVGSYILFYQDRGRRHRSRARAQRLSRSRAEGFRSLIP